ELGAIHATGPEAPFYKIWDLPQRLRRTHTQDLTVKFQSEGKERTMTLELPQADAPDILALIQHHGEQQADEDTAGQWWGDSLWKTTRNSAKWEKSGEAGQSAQQ
ncbi:MAG: hypothetical protein ACRD30_04065, partial [Bryobacteraceae bacterium]